jgi:Protein of unknown function (DUF3800)
MLVFLDDSGDPGFKVKKGSSPCFVIALAIFDDHLEAEACAVEIKKLRRKLGLSDQFEFKFSKCAPDFRKQFLSHVAKFEFRVRAIVMRKSAIYSQELRTSKETFYQYSIRMVLQHSFGTIRNARLKMDGHEDREFRRQLLSYLRKQLTKDEQGVPILSDLKIVDSQNNVLIQLADMVAGTVRRFAEQEKPDASEYRALIVHRIENIWNFG